MSMSHKAYSFDWSAFENDELHRLLLAALTNGDSDGLIRYIEAHRNELKDPYEGKSLDDNWSDMLENRDAHEFGDFALTRFYKPSSDCGLWDEWQDIDELLSKADRSALLGNPLGKAGAYFDPGRLGSYFQTPKKVARSLARVRRFKLPDLDDHQRKSMDRFLELLVKCKEIGSGLYVTF